MVFVRNLSYSEIYKLINKKVRFISDCDLFPNFDIIGKIKSISLYKNELIFDTKLECGRIIQVGSNMKNLKIDVL